MTVTPKSPSVHPATPAKSLTSLSQGLMDELDSLRSRFLHEDSLSVASSEPINIEESQYAALQEDLETDAQDLEGESWSLVVDQDYLKPMSKEAIKRQDVIYELIQTEVHHVRTLKILLSIYASELRESLQVDEARMKHLFFSLDGGLLQLHCHLLHCLKLRRVQSMEAGSHNNYQITQLADILITQFSDELGERMKDFYGAFCCHHREAVSSYKELLQSNKKILAHMRKVGQLSIVRRLGIPECFLLVTQRITKYPILVERIIQNTEAETEEHSSLVRALALIREVISQVDTQVSEYEKATRQRDIAQRLEPKSQGRRKDGRLFSREDLLDTARTLLHDTTVTLKASSGRLKDIHAVLLTDVLFLLQEKDQKLVFSTVDNKPPVISLQRLIVRDVAHEDKAMFLIAASNMPEMYEIHTGSKAERNTLMALIRQAVESYPEEEVKGQEEEQEARATKLKQFKDHLTRRDALIEQNLTEKLHIFAFFLEDLTGLKAPHARLLLRGDASDLQQGETLLKGAITDVECLQNLLLTRMKDHGPALEDIQAENPQLHRAKTFGGFDTRPPISPAKGGEGDESQAQAEEELLECSRLSTCSDPENRDPEMYPEGPELSADDQTQMSNSSGLSFAETEFFDRVLMLSQRLYSLQAIITQQDSRTDQQELQGPTATSSTPRRICSDLLEQERQRNQEKWREEQTGFHRQKVQHQQELQRWEKEREKERAMVEQQEALLAEREEACARLEDRLACERVELEVQRDDYQGDLVRLRESTQKVERDGLLLKNQLEKLQKQNEQTQYLQVSQSFHIDKRRLSPEPRADPTATSNSSPKPNHKHISSEGGSGGMEVPPTVPRRKESMSPAQAVKAEMPIQLVSPTNQPHKEGGVKQQIPTKLAAPSNGSKRPKNHHRSSHQRAASIDMSQVVPIKTTGKEGGSLRARKGASPQRIHSVFTQHPIERLAQRPASNMKPFPSFSAHSRSHSTLPPEPPPFPKDLLKKKEHFL